MSEKTNLLFEKYTIDTPENVIFGYHIAGIGSRFIAVLVDMIILGVVMLAINGLLVLFLKPYDVSMTNIFSGEAETGNWGGGVIIAGAILLEFMMLWGYFTFFELNWNGQTPGKRLAKIRVVQSSGGPVRPLSVIIRNLLRIVDWLPWGYTIGVLTMLLNDQSRRLGDYAADTIVIRLQDDGDEGILSSASSANRAIKRRVAQLSLQDINQLYATYPHIGRLTPAEYELVEDVTFGPRTIGLARTVRPRLVKIISPKVGGPLPQPLGSDIEATRILKDIALLYNIHHSDSGLRRDDETVS